MKQFSLSYEDIISIENLLGAWQEFVRGKSERQDVGAFSRNLMDEIVALHEDLAAGCYQHSRYEQFLRECLSLALHPTKVSIRTVASGADFLGWVHFPDHRVLRAATKRRMFRHIAEHPTEATVQSYLGLLTHGNARRLMQRVRNSSRA